MHKHTHHIKMIYLRHVLSHEKKVLYTARYIYFYYFLKRLSTIVVCCGTKVVQKAYYMPFVGRRHDSIRGSYYADC